MENKKPEGIIFIPKKPNQPDFVRGKLWINTNSFAKWMEENKNEKGDVNIDMLLSDGGKIYLKLNDFQPKSGMSSQNQEIEEEEIDTSELF